MVAEAGMDNESDLESLLAPSPGHPDELLLREAGETLQSIEELAERPDIKHAFARRLEEYTTEIRNVAQLVLDTEHSIAFVGDIGVGKSTAICRIAGLEVEHAPVLETGAGGTTVREVTLRQGADYGLAIEPRNEEEIRREVREFSRYLKSAPGVALEEDTEGPDFPGTSKEIARAIRNMSGLATNSRERGPDGRFVDHARNLAGGFSDSDSLATKS